MAKIKFWVVRALFQLLALMSLPMSNRLGRYLGSCLWVLNGRARQVTEKNLAICFTQMPVEQRKVLAKKSLQHLGAMTFELGASWQWPADRLLKEIKLIDGLEHMEQAQCDGQGVIVLVPHLGNWEVLGLYFAAHYNVTTLYQPPAFASLSKVIATGRGRNGANLVPTNTRGVKALLKTLKGGGVTLILPDQVPPKSGGEYALFFNIPTLTATLSHNLIRRTGAKVVVASILRMDKGKGFRLVFKPVENDTYSEDPLTALTALNKSVENIVMEQPEQYQWEYKRFRRVAPGFTQPYK